MPFDPKDPFDAAALYDMWFNCGGCTASFDFDPGGNIGLRYYHTIGQAAKKKGWFVSENGRFPGQAPTYTVLCPACASKLGLYSGDGITVDSNTEGLKKLCRSLEKRRVA